MKNRITSLFTTIALLVLAVLSVPSHAAPPAVFNQATGQIGTKSTQKLGFYGATPIARRSGADQAVPAAATSAALTGSLTGTLDNALADTPTLTDSPASADALRDDITPNVKPVIDKNFKELQDEVNKLRAEVVAQRTLLVELRAAMVALGLIKGSS